MDSAEAKVSASRQVSTQPGIDAYRNGRATMNVSNMPMSRPLNVPIGGRSNRTRRKKTRASALTATMPTRVTPSCVRLSCRREIGMIWVTGMSGSNECLPIGERGLMQVAAGVAQYGCLVVAHDDQIHVQAGRGEMPAGRGLTVTVDRRNRQGEPGAAVPDIGAVPGGPRCRGQRLDGVDELPRGDHITRVKLQQVVGLAENLTHGGDTRELTGEWLVGQAAGDVAGVIPEDRHAVAVREVRSDHHGAERAWGGRLAGPQVEQLGEAGIQVMVQMGVAAGPPGDRDHFGHAEGVIDVGDAKRLAGRLGQAGREDLAARDDAP